MINRARQLVLVFFAFLFTCAVAMGQASTPPQAVTVPFIAPSSYEGITGSLVAPGQAPPGLSDFDLWSIGDIAKNRSPLQGSTGSVSKLDFKAPFNAQNQFVRGSELMARKDFDDAIGHLREAIAIYPKYVAAMNALGSAYFALGENAGARDQFAKAAELDDHLPVTYLNLACAQIALQEYGAAERSAQRAAAIAPLDLHVASALAYAELMNQDYAAALSTAREVHSRNHQGAAIVHYFAAAAWQNENDLERAKTELEILLKEDPSSPGARQARQVLEEINDRQARMAQVKTPEEAPQKMNAAPEVSEVMVAETAPSDKEVAEEVQALRQQAKERTELAEAEAKADAPETTNELVPTGVATIASIPRTGAGSAAAETPFLLRSVVDEVAVFFTATDHGRSVTDLSRADVGILDDKKPPAVITGFRNESSLPLRLGIVIDTSESVRGQFSFEQNTAAHFLQKVLTGEQDLGFVVGVANSVLLVQDFTSDQQKIAHGIDQLAPAGGTALWDAVAFGARKLATRPETQPVARVLVVISDGNDNSSTTTLNEAIEAAERGGVVVYTVSATAGVSDAWPTPAATPSLIGERALKVCAARTGGTAFSPNTMRGLDHGLQELQQVLRSRYLVTYKPALFKTDGQYREIAISAAKSGRKLRVTARKGYYAKVDAPEANAF